MDPGYANSDFFLSPSLTDIQENSELDFPDSAEAIASKRFVCANHMCSHTRGSLWFGLVPATWGERLVGLMTLGLSA